MMVLMSFNQLFAQNITMNWAKSINGMNQEVGKSVVTDKNGNSYTCGYFTGTADLNPGSSSLMVSSNGMQDIFVTKLDVNGNFVWGKSFGGNGNDMVYSIAIDKYNNVYTTGFFHNNVDFDPSPTSVNLSTYEINSQDIFISKLDSNGNFKWAKSVGGSGFYDSINNYYPAICTGYSIGVDTSGNIYTTGSFMGSIDFDPNNTVEIKSSLSVSNIFVQKWDSNANLIWVNQIGENKKGDEAYALCLDASANCIITGVFADTMDTDPGSGVCQLISSSYTNVFVLKVNTNGDFMWGVSVGGNQPNEQASGYSLTSDSIGQLYISGIFKGQLNLNLSTGNYPLFSSGNYDVFVFKLNQNGETIWGKSFGGNFADYCYSIKLDELSNIYLTGAFKGDADFDPGTNQFILSSITSNANDIFIVRLNSLGNFQWAERIGGNGNDLANSIDIHTNQILLTGYFSNTLNLSTALNLSALGGVDALILHLNQFEMLLPVSLLQFEGITVQAGNLLKWTCDKNITSKQITIERSEDGTNYTALKTFHDDLNAQKLYEYVYLDTLLTSQELFYRLKLTDENSKSFYSKTIVLKHSELANQFLVYPNPCKGQCSIISSAILKDASIQLISLKGEMVYMQKIQNKKSFNIDLSNQPSGMYILHIHEKFASNYKLIKSTKIQIIN